MRPTTKGCGCVEGHLEGVMGLAREMRERSDPFPTFLVWQSEGDAETLLALVEGTTGNPSMDLDFALTRMREVAGDPQWFAAVLDAYARNDDVVGSNESLEEAFLAGDMSTVEQIVVMLSDEDGTITVMRQVYRNTPVDGWEWDEPQRLTQPLPDNGLVEVMQRHSQI